MDHLSQPTEPFQRPLQIPFLVKDGSGYDGLGFVGFPSRNGMSIDTLRFGPTLWHTKEDLLSFMQSWLFFGFLQKILDVCRIKVVPEDFVRLSDNGDQVLTTSILPQLVVAWQMRESGASQAERSKRLQEIDRIISHAQTTVYDLANANWIDGTGAYASAATSVEVGPKIILSLVVIGEAIVFARETIYKNRMLRVPVATGGESFKRWPSLRYLDHCLAAAGWCPFDIKTLRTQVNNSCRYYLSMLGRTTENHRHSECTSSYCILNRMNASTYQTSHVTQSCQCPFLTSESPEQPAVSTVLESGNTPLVALLPGQNGARALQVLSSCDRTILGALGHSLHKTLQENNSRWVVRNQGSRPSIRYVAISHVWRGGLGNPSMNSLPACQLERIQDLVNRLYGSRDSPVPLWIDTLCVPLPPGNRRLAIQNMKAVYQNADKVLVLDTFLESSKLSANATENLMRIHSSSWMQRLWTFQEGILAQSLYFQFAQHDFVRGEDLLDDMMKDRKQYLSNARGGIEDILEKRVDRKGILADLGFHPYKVARSLATIDPWTERIPRRHDTIAQEAYRSFKAIRVANSFDSKTLLKKQHEAEVLAQLSMSLEWRRTTRTEDEAVVLTNLLGLNTKDLMDVRAEISMKRVFTSISFVPVDVLFAPRDHLRDEGCSWIPMSLLNGQGHMSLGPREGRVVKHGFKVNLPGLLLAQEPHLSCRVLIPICVSGGATYFLEPRFLEADAKTLGRHTGRPEDSTTEDQWAIILRRPLAVRTPVEGAIVKIVTIKRKQICVRWYGVAVVQPEPPTRGDLTLMSTSTAANQEWLIS
ncbi:hypothetical protein AB5N19_03989 [Seiridium cardinale]